MPSVFIPVPEFPNVPDLPGVPPLNRMFGAALAGASALINGASDAVSFLEGDAQAVLSLFSGPQWGIFDSALNPVIEADSVVEFDYANDYRLANYPLEQGGFESYNKVATPFEVRFTITKGGSASDRTAFIQAIETAKASLDLYTAVTPEYTYQSANVIHADYDRKAEKGATLITAYIHLQEVRITATAAYTNTATAAGANQTDGGSVQATTPTAAQISGASELPLSSADLAHK